MDETTIMTRRPKFITIESNTDQDMNKFKNSTLFTQLHGKLNKDLTADPNDQSYQNIYQKKTFDSTNTNTKKITGLRQVS